MGMKLIILPIVIVFAHSSMGAVGPEDFTVGKSDANAPSAKLQISSTSTMDFDSAAGGFSLDRMVLDMPIGGLIPLGDSNALGVGMSYEGTRLNTRLMLGDKNLHDLRLGITWYHHAQGSPWSLLATVSPGISSDFSKVSGDDFSLNWLSGVRYAWTDKFALVAGLGSDTSTGDDSVFFTLGFQWQATDDIYVSLVGATFIATWQPCEDWLWRVGVWPEGGIWNVENGGASFDVNLKSYRAAIGLEHRLRDKMWLTIWAGATFANELEIETTGGTRVFRDDAEMGWFVNLGLRVAAW